MLCTSDPHHQDGPLPLQRVLEIATDVSRGMEYLHGRNIVHRDVKVGSCWVASSSRVVARKLPVGYFYPENPITQHNLCSKEYL